MFALELVRVSFIILAHCCMQFIYPLNTFLGVIFFMILHFFSLIILYHMTGSTQVLDGGGRRRMVAGGST